MFPIFGLLLVRVQGGSYLWYTLWKTPGFFWGGGLNVGPGSCFFFRRGGSGTLPLKG